MVPYLYVEDPIQYLDFLKHAFNAHELGRSSTPNGRLANLRVQIGTTSFMIGGLGGGLTKMPTAHKLYAEDVDKAIVQAISAGAIMQYAPVDMPYGDRQAIVADPCGNTWFICTRMVHEPYDSSAST